MCAEFIPTIRNAKFYFFSKKKKKHLPITVIIIIIMNNLKSEHNKCIKHSLNFRNIRIVFLKTLYFLLM